MSFEVTYETLSRPHFRQALQKVLNAESKDHKVVYNLGRIGDKIEQNIKEAQRTFRKLAQAHKVLGEHGTIEDGASENEDWMKAHDEFMAHPVKVERHKIRVDDIKDVALTPLELSALEPVLDGLDDLR